MEEEIRSRLLSSIAANRLAIFCGAGLSMAPPTELPSAARLAGITANSYEVVTGSTLPPDLHQNLEELARHIWRLDQLVPLFIGNLIDWRPFRRRPNPGHTALADFLLCGGAEIVVSTNYDTHIEDAAYELGEADFLPALDGDDLQTTPSGRKPLLKLHGCCHKDRKHTIWLQEQLDSEPIKTRLKLSGDWLRSNLRQRDLVFVGFWSDWYYLNHLLEEIIESLPGEGRRTVILVDPAPWSSLRNKAPKLSAWVEESSQVAFFHAQEPGEVFLEDLRSQLSLQFLRRLVAASEDTYQRVAGGATDAPSLDAVSDTADGLYKLRQDIVGVLPFEPIRALGTERLELVGSVFRKFLSSGAVVKNGVLHSGGETVRIFNAAGRLMSEVKSELSRAVESRGVVDAIICVSVTPDPTPSDILRPDAPSTIVRPRAALEWKTEQDIFGPF